MAPEQDARMRAFYDHERDEPSPRGRRRAAADWGVGEDIFDRMPSRRLKRADRRAEHRDDHDAGRFERRVSGPAAAPPTFVEREQSAPRYDDWADAHERRQVAPRRGDWADDRRQAAESGHGDPRRQGAPRRRRRPVESWTEGVEAAVEVEGKRPIESWLAPERGESRTIVLGAGESGTIVLERDASGPMEPGAGAGGTVVLGNGESRTVVLAGDARELNGLDAAEPARVEAGPQPVAMDEPPARRTVVITGRPDRLPVPRTQRPPRTALERIGTRPDRI